LSSTYCSLDLSDSEGIVLIHEYINTWVLELINT